MTETSVMKELNSPYLLKSYEALEVSKYTECNSFLPANDFRLSTVKRANGKRPENAHFQGSFAHCKIHAKVNFSFSIISQSAQ